VAGSAAYRVVIAFLAEVGITGFHRPGAVDVVATVDLAGCLGAAVVVATDGASAGGVEVITAANHARTDVASAWGILGVRLSVSGGTTQGGCGSD